MNDGDNSLPAMAEKPSLLEFLDSFLPFRIPRIPLIRTATNLDKAAARLILAKSEERAARIEATTAKIKQQSNAEGRFLEVSERVAEQALKRSEIPIDVAFSYLESETKIKFKNSARVFEEATKQLTLEPPTNDAKTEIDDDWLNMFSRIAEEKSSEQLQNLFGKILAGEIREPGSISMRTLTVVSTLNSNEANIIVEAFKFVIAHNLIFDDAKSHKSDFKTLPLLAEMGIVSGLGGLFSSTYKIAPLASISLWGSMNGLGIKNLTDAELAITIGGCFLTEAGKHLQKIAIVGETPTSYLRDLASSIASGTASLGLNSPLKGKAEFVLLAMDKGNVLVGENFFPETKLS